MDILINWTIPRRSPPSTLTLLYFVRLLCPLSVRLSLTLASSSVGSTTLTWTPTEYAMLDSHGSGAAQVHICRRALTHRKHGCAKTLQLYRRMSWATPPPMNSKSQQGCSTARRFFDHLRLELRASIWLWRSRSARNWASSSSVIASCCDDTALMQ